MKTMLGIVIVLIGMTSCMGHYACPTYSGTKARQYHASAKKSKPSKGKIAAAKSIKMAETD